MAAQVTQLLDEKCKVLETLSKCQQEVGTCLTHSMNLKSKQLMHFKSNSEVICNLLW